MVSRIHFVFLNVGHFYDHLFMLVFATVAALTLSQEWGMGYAELIPYATPGFVAFGVGAVPAGWLADKWSRKGMMFVFYMGIGLSSIFTALSNTPVQIGIGLLAMGFFAAIYHPVGLALVVQGREKRIHQLMVLRHQVMRCHTYRTSLVPKLPRRNATQHVFRLHRVEKLSVACSDATRC